jgi:hypothetical protein
MKLVKIDSRDVDEYPESYNSSFHTALEAPDVPVPTEVPQHYSRWLPLISSSQRIPSDLIQTITLTPTQGRLLHVAAQASIHTRKLNRIFADELADIILPSLSALAFPPEGLFLRLDASSPKDGVHGTQALETADDVVLRLTTSSRAINAIMGSITDGANGIPLYFLPFNAKMRTQREFRTFCPPGKGGISAVSQYKWHTQSIFAEMSEDDLCAVIERIFRGIEKVYREILDVARERNDELDELMMKQGFTFDVLCDGEEEICQLIELNPFGTRSGCGSCLFHWLRDGDTLYMKKRGEESVVEFRISV